MCDGEVVSANGKGAHAPASQDTSESPAPAPPPDGGWGWFVVFASFMIHIATDGLTYSFGIFFDELRDYFKTKDAETSLIISIMCGITLGSGPLTSWLVNRWGCRRVTIIGGMLAAGCITVSAFAGNILTLMFTIGVGTGFGCGLIYLPAIVSVTVWFERYRSLATGIAVCGSGLGAFIFPPLVKGLISSYGWRGAMAVVGALMLNCVPLGLMFLPVPEIRRIAANEPMLPKQNKSPLKISQSTEHIARENGNVENGDVARLTLSQPALNKSHGYMQQPHSRHGSGIMARPDVLYQGSMTSLSKIRLSLPEKNLTTTGDSESKSAKMLDLSLLLDPIFVLFSFSNILTNLGFYIPYVYTVSMSEKLRVPDSAYLLSIMGASSLVGRIVLGFISDKPWVNRLMLYNMCLTIAGISIASAAFCTKFWTLAMYAVTYGVTSGAYVGLTSVVLVDLMGLDKLTNAFGLLLFFQGIASLIGSRLGGMLADETKSYMATFCVAGALVSISGAILFMIPMMKRRTTAAGSLVATVNMTTFVAYAISRRPTLKPVGVLLPTSSCVAFLLYPSSINDSFNENRV